MQDHKAVWVWFEGTNGRWSCYNSDSNNQIETAYQNGDNFLK